MILGSMIQLIQFLLTLVTTSVRSRLSLQAENAALRNQLFLYRKSGQGPRIRPTDRLLWCFIAKYWSGWRAALYFVQPRTVTTWQIALGKRGGGGTMMRWRNLLLESSWCKSSPVKAVAGRPVASVAIRRATGGCEAYIASKQAVRIQLRNR